MSLECVQCYAYHEHYSTVTEKQDTVSLSFFFLSLFWRGFIWKTKVKISLCIFSELRKNCSVRSCVSRWFRN